MSAAKIQHYVPQFLLRNFGTGKKDQLHVFDKHTGKTFTPNAKNIASESRFYDFEVAGEAVSLEPMLSKLETAAKPALDAIIRADSVAVLDRDAKALLAAFLSVQFVRTRAFREQWADFPKMLRDHLGSRAEQAASGSQAEALMRDLSENDLKAQTADFLVKAPQSFSHHFLDKAWVLIATSRKAPFMLGDHPLAMQNQTDMSPYGNLGLGVKGIEIYFPMTPTRALALWCPSLAQQVSEGAATLRRMPRWKWDGRIEHAEGILSLDASLRDGSPVNYVPQNVENFNSLQVLFSERYVFSVDGAFDLVRRILGDHPSARRGFRMQTE